VRRRRRSKVQLAAITLVALALTGCGTSPAAQPSVNVSSLRPPTPSLAATVPPPSAASSLGAPSSLPSETPATAPVSPSPVPSPSPAVLQPVAMISDVVGLAAVLAWSPDSRLLAWSAGGIGSTDHTATLTTPDGKLILRLVGHTEPVTSLAWSPNGTIVASGSLDGTVRLWTPAGRLIRILDPAAPPTQEPWHSSQPVFNVAWSPDGSLLATGAINFGTPAAPNPPNILPGVVRVWRPSGSLVRTLGTSLTGGKFLNLAWSPDGTLLAAGADDFHVWRADGTELGSTGSGGSPAWAMAWSPDGTRFATGDENGNLLLYDSAGHRLAAVVGLGGIFHVAFSPDGNLLAVAGQYLQLRSAANPGTVITQLGVACCSLTGQAGLAWSPDGSSIAGGLDPMIWSRQGQTLSALGGCPGIPLVLAWSPDGAWIAAGSDGGRVCLWRAP
jgi:WD40 repeat protein